MVSNQAPSSANPLPTRRRKWVFSLRSLLIALLAFCILLGLYARRAPYRYFVKKADEYGCNRHYKTFRLGPALDSVVFGLDDLIGTGTLNTPCDLGFFESLGQPVHTYSDDEFSWLFKIHSLEEFRADGIYLNDELATKLAEAHPRLHTINSQNTRLTASGAAAIAERKNITILRLSGDLSLNDEVVREFENMPGLTYLALNSPSISDIAIQRLKKALPHCKVHGP